MLAFIKIIGSRIPRTLSLSLPLVLLLTQPTFAQTNEEVYFFDDFEYGNADGWELGPGWQVEDDDGNYVLSGSGQNWPPTLRGEYTWRNYSLKAKIKLITESVQVNYRFNVNSERYIIRLNLGKIDLAKTSPSMHMELVSENIQINHDEWHTVEIIGNGGDLEVFFDDALLIVYSDPDPILDGKIAFDNPDDGHVHIDDVLVVGEPFPKPPPGYSWIKLGGPRGGRGYDVQFHPNDPTIIFVTDTFAGIHKTEDGGETWVPKNKDILSELGIIDTAPPIFSLTIDMSNPNIIWAGLQATRGIVKSTDGGETWVAKMNGIPELENMEFRGFTIDPNNSDIVYCGGNYSPDSSDSHLAKGFIFKTVDGGENWTQILECGALVRWIRIDPTNTDVIYASTGIFDRKAVEQEGVLKSTDGGQTWFNINNGLTCLAIGGLFMHPNDPKTLFAVAGQGGGDFVTYPTDEHGYIFKTANGGENWDLIYGPDEYSAITAVAISPSNPDIIYADSGVEFMLKSTDGGNTWIKYDNGPADETAGWPIGLAIHPTNSDIVYVDAYKGGVYMTQDGGKTWSNASKGYSGAQCWDVAVAGDSPNYVFVAQALGTYTSKDGGETWQGTGGRRAGRMGVDLEEHKSVAINPSNTNEMIVGSTFRGIIVKTEDKGETWRLVFQTIEDPGKVKLEDRVSIYRIAYSRSEPNVVYAATGMAQNVIDDVDRYKQGPGVFKSMDSGETWIAISNGLEETTKNILDVAVHPSNSNVVYIGTLNSGIYKTFDGGESWTPKNNGLISLEARALAIDPTNSEVVYGGFGEGVGIFKSTDGGEMWFEANLEVSMQDALPLFYVGKTKLGTSSFASGPWTQITSIVIDPTDPNVVYAADWVTGIYRSIDGGVIWIPINKGLSGKPITRLTISSNGKVLYTTTEGAGVFRLTLTNYPPELLSTFPNADSTISVAQGDSVKFEVMAYDLNADTLFYSWTLDNLLIDGETSSTYLLRTTDLQPGYHSLTAEVADLDTFVSITWDIEVAILTKVEEEQVSNIPQRFALLQNYPNPFNAETVIRYELPKPATVVVSIYNLLGQKIKTLVNQQMEAGYQSINWDARNEDGHGVASGIYIYQIEAKAKGQRFLQNRKMILLR